MSASKVPFVIRVPLIPTITDTPENMGSIASTIRNLPGLLHVDLLPYNIAAGAKYKAVGMQWKPDFDENKPVNVDLSIFTDAGITVFIK
jgi:pyruvate formate lyase activating enzyme